MEQLEQYIKEMGEDVDLDEFNLKDVQLKLPALKHKWVGRLIRAKGSQSAIQDRKDNVIMEIAKGKRGGGSSAWRGHTRASVVSCSSIDAGTAQNRRTCVLDAF